jgi:DinB family protein
MIPTAASDIPKYITSLESQTEEVRGIFAAHSSEALLWRPNEQKWSVAGHVSHMCIVNEPYIAAMQACLMKNKGRKSDGPYKHPWFGRWFAGQMEPPPKKRWKTTKEMLPDPTAEGADALERFLRVQGDLAQVVDDSRGIDLGKARFSSPFMKLVRFSMGSAMGTIDGHNRRHIWLAREVIDGEGFPAAGA